MSIHTTKKEQQSLETRKNILRAASSLFFKYGVSKVSMRDIASEAQVTTGALYHHFGSKEALMQEIGVDRESNLKKIKETINESSNALEKLLEFIDLFLQSEIESNGKEIHQFRLKNRNPKSISGSAPINPLPESIIEYISEAQNNGLLDSNWPQREICQAVLIELWGIHYDYSVSADTFSTTDAIYNRIPLILRAFAPGTFASKDWWKSS